MRDPGSGRKFTHTAEAVTSAFQSMRCKNAKKIKNATEI